jgi:hypothetical protein
VEVGGGGQGGDPFEVEGEVALEVAGVAGRGLEAGGGQPRPQ